MNSDSAKFANRWGSQRGSSLIEYGVVLVVMMTMIFGLIDFGRAMYAYHFVSNAAREGTRYAMVRGSTCNSNLSGCPVQSSSDVLAYLQNVPAGIDPSQLSVNATWNPNNSPSCPVSESIYSPGCVVEVQVSYNFSFLLPFVPRNTVVMQSSSQMVISQ
jgi:Flp pilus assembly protein TadG